jgi:hypothetical protein
MKFSFSRTAIVFASVLPCFASLVFEPNRNQTDRSVRYLARTASGVVFLTDGGMVLHRGNADSKDTVRLLFTSAAGKPQPEQWKWEPMDPTGHSISYFVGRDPNQWLRGLPQFQRVVQRDVVPGIDLVFYGNPKNQLEYDLIVAPGVDPAGIRMQITASGSHQGIRLAKNGDLLIGDAIRQKRPTVYQMKGADRQIIEGRFRRLSRGEFAFDLGAFDRRRPLFIDPVVESSTYLGGIGDDTIVGIDGMGNVIGTTSSIDFPGAEIAKRRGNDVFIRGLYSTVVVGGSGDDVAGALAVTQAGNQSFRFVAGTTNSRDLPTSITPSANSIFAQREFAGGATDGFLVFWSDLWGVAVQYLGSSGDDEITSFSVTPNDRFFVCGHTNGANLFASAGAPSSYQYAGGVDAFFARGTYSGTSVQRLASYYLGGSGDDRAYTFAHSAGTYYIAGETSSPNFPLVQPAVQTQRRGPSDGFIVQTSPTDSGNEPLIQSTLFGGSGTDRIQAIAQHTVANGYAVAGTTSSADLPLAVPTQSTYGGGPNDAFFATVSSSLSQMFSSSYLGGSGSDEGLAIYAEYDGYLSVAGRTTSLNFPVRRPLQAQHGGGLTDGFLQQVDPAGAINFATYYGGSGEDSILSISPAIFSSIVAVAGSTTSTNLPGSNFPANEPFRSGTREGFTARISSGDVFMQSRSALAKDMRTIYGFQIGDRAKAQAALSASVSSSDPSRVVVTFSTTQAGTASDSISWTGAFSGNFAADCLTDNGGADVTLTISGYTPKILHVSCVPLRVSLAGQKLTVSVWNSFVSSVYLVAIDPETGAPNTVMNPRPSAPATIVSIQSTIQV